ncbi:Hsp70 family protein [Paludisphaera sp.]|uniref:Hsp70 family protein n=1 Tax=Paludisphaera sp. TaxID=2017432 RepID=UPI00301DACCE
MTRTRYIVGIDLGTTNCAVSYVDTKGKERPAADIRAFEVPQLVAPGETAPRPMLPSFVYLPAGPELPAGASRLPWNEGSDRIVGEFARIQGAKVPSRLVASAKSWLCHGGVDREADILPWGAPPEARKISPVEASADTLIHIRDAWNHAMSDGEASRRLENQEIVLTVPASFDEAARELTVEAAKRAGLERVTLLEEPQAAFYCWIVTHQDRWQREVRAGELILVCDIGGGTTDFSLITVAETPTGPGFRRVAVGDHLMLGGDNIDLALAHHVEKKLGGARLDGEQWSALRFACRTAKEKLLSDQTLAQERWPVTIAGRGSRIIGGGIQSELTRDEVREIALDGFFPKVAPGEEPSRGSRAGLQEFGLPFVADPAVPRHLAAFLRRHQAEAGQGQGGDGAAADRPARPDAILFNGGALTPATVRDRIVEVMSSWFAGDPGAPYAPRVLSNASLDLAVAHGAAYYGVVRRGGGIRIGGGTARSFYVGLEGDPARPWLCVVPRDAEEGDEIAVAGRDFDLLMGQPVVFPLASSSVRPDDKPGDLVASDPDSIRELPPLQGLMRVGRKAKAERAAVSLAARVTEVGTIELWCQSRADGRRWRLQIQLRGAAEPRPRETVAGEEADRVVVEQGVLDAATAAIRAAFEAPASAGNAEGGPARLVKALEEILEVPRDAWPPSALRAMWEPLRDLADHRLKGPRHESRWFNMAGYALRPGRGFPLDEIRIKALWPVFHQGVTHSKDVQCWAEWWILWRRVAAGLTKAHHDEIHRRLAPFLTPPKGSTPAKKAGRPKPEAHEIAEMWRCAAGLERLAASVKEPLGAALAAELARPTIPGHVLWSLGRLGARVPLYGPANTVVRREAAERWVDALAARDYAPGRETADAIFALAQLARASGDRVRDLSEPSRAKALDKLAGLGADEATLRPVREYHDLEASPEGQALGDSLPIGLRLRTEAEPAGD